jgi:hypothetical protein
MHVAIGEQTRLKATNAFVVRAGRRAAARIASRGLQPGDIACIPAAAGGPKGLGLLAFDRLLQREWLPPAKALQLVGASIGAWRMAALAQPDAPLAIDRLQHCVHLRATLFVAAVTVRRWRRSAARSSRR